ncbi:MAG: putative molybdenum carrier protein [Pseudomonadota bacterium]
MSTLIIISGGQTGVDRAALDAAIQYRVSHGGWCPKGRLAEDGQIPMHYQLTETDTDAYPQRTKMNVQSADGTLIIFKHIMTSGTALTLKFVKQLVKPNFILDIDQQINIDKVNNWMNQNTISTLNIAGPRESTTPGIYADSKKIIEAIIKQKI